MPIHPKPRVRVACLAVVALLTLACGGDDSSDETSPTSGGAAATTEEGTTDGPASTTAPAADEGPPEPCELVDDAALAAAVDADLAAAPERVQTPDFVTCRYLFGTAAVQDTPQPGEVNLTFGEESVLPGSGLVEISTEVMAFPSSTPEDRGLVVVDGVDDRWTSQLMDDVVLFDADRALRIRITGGLIPWAGPGELCAASGNADGCVAAVPNAELPDGTGSEVSLAVADLVAQGL